MLIMFIGSYLGRAQVSKNTGFLFENDLTLMFFRTKIAAQEKSQMLAVKELEEDIAQRLDFVSSA